MTLPGSLVGGIAVTGFGFAASRLPGPLAGPAAVRTAGSGTLAHFAANLLSCLPLQSRGKRWASAAYPALAPEPIMRFP